MRGSELTHHNQSCEEKHSLQPEVWDHFVLCWTSRLAAEKPIFIETVEWGRTDLQQTTVVALWRNSSGFLPNTNSSLHWVQARLILFFWCGRLQNNGSEIFGLSVLFQIGTPVTTTSSGCKYWLWAVALVSWWDLNGCISHCCYTSLCALQLGR